MKQSTELNNLLALIFQDGRTEVKDSQLLIPVEIAKRFGDQIKKHKPEIMKSLGHCPKCGGKLTVKVELIKPPNGEKHGTHSWCPSQVGHYDKWEF